MARRALVFDLIFRDRGSGLVFDKATRGLNRLQQTGKRIEGTGRTLTRGLTLPLVGAGIASAKLATDFQASMSKITGLVGVSQTQVSAWSDQVLELAKTLPQSPKELADALFFVTSAGLRGKDAMDALTVSARGAAAGLGETKVVADAITSAVNAYGSANLSAAKAGDVLTATVREGKTEAADLAPVLGRILPLASEMGVRFEDVGASLAAMTRIGLDADEAATSLQAVMSGLIKPSTQGAKALEGVGLSYAKIREEIRVKGLFAALMDVREAFHGNQEQIAKVIPNVQALRGFMSLTGSQAEATRGIFDRMKDSTGSLDKAFEAAAQTSQFKFKAALSSLQVAGIKIGSQLLPVFDGVAQRVAKMADAIGDLPAPTRKALILFGGLAATLGPLLIIAGKLVQSYAAIRAAIIGTNAVLAAHRTAAATTAVAEGELATATAGGAVAAKGAAASFTALKVSAGTLGLALAALGAIWFAVTTKSKDFHKVVTDQKTAVDRYGLTLGVAYTALNKHGKATKDDAEAQRVQALEAAFAEKRQAELNLEMAKAIPQYASAADKAKINAEAIQDLSGKLDKAREEYAALKQPIQDAILGFDGLISKSKVTAKEVIASLHDQVLNFRTYAHDTQRLLKAGVDPAAIQELSQKGPQYVHALATGSNAQLRLYKQYWHDRQAEIKTSFEKSMQKQYEGLVAKIRAMERALRMLQGKNISITAFLKLGFTKSFSQKDWVQVRQLAGRMAGGGQVGGGGTPGRDSQLRLLAPDEHVWTGREVAAAGGHAAMQRWRKAVLGLAPGMAGGGPVGRIDAETGAINRVQAAGTGVRMDAGITRLLSMFAPGGVANVDRVARWTALVLGRVGEWAAWARRIRFESGGNWSAVNRCVTLDTMILTRRGWLKHDEVRVGDETIGYNPATGCSEWTPIAAVHHYTDAPLVRIGNKRWSVECTPNHRWIDEPTTVSYGELPERCWLCSWPEGVRRRGRTTEGGLAKHLGIVHGLRRIPLDFLRSRTSRMIETQDLSLTSHSNIRIAAVADTGTGLPVSMDEAEFLGWLLGDGHVDRRTRQVSRGREYSKSVRVTLAQAKPQFVPVCRDLVAKIDSAAREYVRRLPSGLSSHVWFLSVDVGISLLERSGYDEPETMVLRMSAEQRQAFLRGVIGAEGHLDDVGPGQGSRGGQRVVIPQNYGAKHDAIKLAIFLCGFRPSVTDRTAYNARHGWAPAGTINTCRPYITPLFREDAGRADVWCVTTDLGTWTAEQNGQIFLTGNSDSNWFAGHPSVGGAQVIRGTFQRWANGFRNVGPFLYGVSVNPWANSFAGGNYAVHRYGSLAAVDPRTRPYGYDHGGWLPPGLSLAWNGTGRAEPVGGGGMVRLHPDSIRAIADELRANPPVVRVDDVHTGLLGKRNRQRLGLGLG